MSGYRKLYKELVKPSQRLITDYLVKEKKITEVPKEALPCRSDDVILSSSDGSDLAPIHKRTLGSVTELRRSRRLQGREPILQPLPQRIEMEDDHRPTVNGSYLPCQRQRDPSTFSGDGNINPGQWLKEYERVSKYKRWDETMKLANVVFYLNGTAGRWFDNNE
ncbi:hypothetical protein LAZ67_7000707 [Cordylochernes scorpioides]|uniref:Uncharacterized protein n=1 Tax=Cordylochernes scorpioides TaxID=51811 RepID=A0ABY6KLP5_9ARAC|nr:hypothetical protein LAZ67_7000707 [Cordylochernes scorpioides]